MESVEKIQPNEVVEPHDAQEQSAPGGRGPRRPFSWGKVRRSTFFLMGWVTNTFFWGISIWTLLAVAITAFVAYQEGTRDV